jgi:hypothetical protein
LVSSHIEEWIPAFAGMTMKIEVVRALEAAPMKFGPVFTA